MAQSRLDILIAAKNQASSTIKGVNQDLGSMQQHGSMASAAMGKLGAAMGAAFGAIAVGQISQAAFELGELGANAQRMERSFANLSGGPLRAADSLEQMRSAARGTIDDMALMQAANTAAMLDVAQSGEEMAQLIEVASARGQALGRSAAEALGDITLGLSRESEMLLDNLGITIDAVAAKERYAQSIGKTAEELTGAERKQALLNDVLRSSATLLRDNQNTTRDTAAEFERMDSSIQNARTALGELFAPATAVVASAIADAAQAAADGMMAMAERGDSVETLQMRVDGLSGALENHKAQLASSEEGTRSYDIASKRVAETQQELDVYTAQLNARLELQRMATLDADAAMRQASGGTAELRGEFIQLGNAADATAPKIANMGLEARLAAQEFDYLMNRVRSDKSALMGIASGLVDNLGAEGTQQWLEDQNAALTEQRKLWEQAGIYSDDYIDSVLQPAFLSGLREQANELDRSEKAAVKLASAVPQISQAYSDLQSAVQSALSAQLDPGVGVDPADFLPRIDAANEDARRLADVVVNGFNSPWAEYLNGKFPDLLAGAFGGGADIKQLAAQQLQDFQAGLRPDLIDSSAVKDLAKRMILGDQSMADLAQELTRELAGEMNISEFEAAKGVSRALGGGGMETSGSDAMEMFTLGAETALTSSGQRIVSAAEKSMSAVYGQLQRSGEDAGRMWGTGFLSTVGVHVPPGLVNILVDLVVPGVQSEFYRRSTMTGAVE